MDTTEAFPNATAKLTNIRAACGVVADRQRKFKLDFSLPLPRTIMSSSRGWGRGDSTAPFAPDGFHEDLFSKGGEIGRTRGMTFLQSLAERRARAEAPARPSDRQVEKWSETHWPHHRHRFRAMEALAYQALGRAMVRQVPVTDRLRELAIPATVIVGLDDEAFLASADRLAREVSGAVRADIPDAGHHPHGENTPAWLDAVSAHLERTGTHP